MSNFEQFLGGSEKLGEVIPMVSSEMPTSFSASGGTYLKSGYALSNSSGLYNTYKTLTKTDTILLTANGTTKADTNVLKSGTNYISGKYYTTDINGTWTLATGGALTTNLYDSFIVGTTVVHTPSADSLGSLEYSTDNGVTYTSVVGNNIACRGVVNAAGTLAMVVKTAPGTSAGDIYTSTDGITWTSRTPSVAMGTILSIIWSPVLSAFVIKTSSGTYSSTDGFTFTQLSTTAGLAQASSSTSLVMLPSGTSTTFLRSTDGVTWAAAVPFVTGLTLFSVNRIVYYLGTYIALGSSGVIFTSTDDGVTWSRKFIAFDNDNSLVYPYVGLLEGALYVSSDDAGISGGKIKTNASLTVNGVMAKVKAEPTEGYAYVRIQ